MEKWFVIRLNPEPWEIGPVSIGRTGGNMRPFVGRNNKVFSFQEAIREELEGTEILRGEVEVALFLWRQLYVHEATVGRKSTAHVADATNMQKAIEDALQGVLIENDRFVRKISTTVMQQDAECEGLIVVSVKPFEPAESDVIPAHVWNEIQQIAPLPWSDPSHDIMGDIQRIKSEAFREGIRRSSQSDPTDLF